MGSRIKYGCWSLTKVPGHKPFGRGAAMTCDDPEILYIDWTGEVFDESDGDDDWDDYFGDDENVRLPLEFN
jgi:hypothetical protein